MSKFEVRNEEDIYEFIRVLDKQDHDEVHCVRRRQDKQFFALRLVRSEGPQMDEHIEKAIAMYSKLKHKHLLNYVESFVSSKGTDAKKIYVIVTELAEDDLQNLLQRQQKNLLPEDKILQIFFQICHAIKYLHSEGLIHRNLKTSHILFQQNGAVKISGLRFATRKEDKNEDAPPIIGSKDFIPPEIDTDLPAKQRKAMDKPELRVKIDNWCLGTILYNMCVGILPFKSLDDKIKGKYAEGLPQIYSDIIYNLIEGLLMYPPTHRMDIPGIFQEITENKNYAEVEKIEVQEQIMEAPVELNKPKKDGYFFTLSPEFKERVGPKFAQFADEMTHIDDDDIVEETEFRTLTNIADDEMYEGEWKVGTGIRHGRGKNYRRVHKDLWELQLGSFKNGEMNGYGLILYTNEDSYLGDVIKGRYDGEGTYTWRSGEYAGNEYLGGFEDGYRQGKGIYNMKNGASFEGHFEKAIKHGFGALTMPDKDLYEGEFRNNLPDGKGVWVYADGRQEKRVYKEGKCISFE